MIAQGDADKPLSADDVIERLCKLQADVQDALGYQHSADCFCGRGGFWDVKGYGGTFDDGYRNDGKALEFIERVVRKALAAKTQQGKTDDQR